MKKRIILAIIAVISVLGLILFSAYLGAKYGVNRISKNEAPIEEIYKVEIILKPEPEILEKIESDNIDILHLEADKSKTRMEAAEDMVAAACRLGYDEGHPILVFAQKEYKAAKELYDYYIEQIKIIETARWEKYSHEYPIATKVWLYLKELGYNDYICAGIMGNLMAETGGHTLNLKPDLIADQYYYGICQWYQEYFPEVWMQDLDFQLEYLKKTIKSQIDTHGWRYEEDFNYEKFLMITNEKDAALAFAKCYERCNSKYFEIRRKHATTAYDYYVDKTA